MMLSADKLNRLRELIGGAPRKIALLCHTNPDGDTIGAALAWRAYLERLGHTTCCIAPSRVSSPRPTSSSAWTSTRSDGSTA